MSEQDTSGRKNRESGKLKDIFVFLIFLCIATIFWLIVTFSQTSNAGLYNHLRSLFNSTSGV